MYTNERTVESRKVLRNRIACTKWRKDNIKHYRSYQAEYHREYYQDIARKNYQTFLNMLNHSITRYLEEGELRESKYWAILGYDCDDFLTHVKNECIKNGLKFDERWTYNISHIRPASSYKLHNYQSIKRAFSLKNLTVSNPFINRITYTRRLAV